MTLRVRLLALLTGAACSVSDAQPSPPPARSGAPAVLASLPPGKVTPVTTMFVGGTQAMIASDGAPPWSLTASDGSGLILTRVDAKAVVEGPLAFTELHLYFKNPEARTREGTFSITLPTGAAVSRFAMESDGRFMEAEVVEKQLARRAYEDFLHRRQDPALLEKGEGNQFTARVFPIPASGEKHLVVSYSQEVTPGHYALPLRGLAKSDRIDVRVQVRGAAGGIAEQTMSERNWRPDRDVVVDATTIGAPLAISAGELVAARLKVELPSAAEVPAAVTVLVDTSASRALGFAATGRAVRSLVGELARQYGGGLAVQLVAFDQDTALLYDGRADRLGDVEAQLRARGALGASDLGQALRWLAAHGARSRIVVVTDGVITAGAKPEALRAQAKELAAKGVARIDVALTGGIRDEQAAGALARGALPRPGAVLDLDRGAPEVARRIGLAVRTEVPVTADGARWVFPRSIEAAQAGDEVTVFVRRAAPGQSLTVAVAGQRVALTPVGVTPALLGRAFAGAEIAELDRQLLTATGAAAEKLRAEIVRRSVAARVVSSQTSMLVLESDADYARYSIDRRALAEILTVGPSGVELARRALPPAQIAAPANAPASEDRGGESKAKAGRARDGAAASMAAPKPAPSGGASADGAVAFDASKDAKKESDDRMGGLAAEPRPPESAALPPPPPPPPPAPSAAPVEISRAQREELPRIAVRNYQAGSAAGAGRADAGPRAAMIARRPQQEPGDGDDDGLAANRRKPALHGPLAEIEGALRAGRVDAALTQAQAWHLREPGDVLALIGLGDALEAKRELATAARVYGSIIDLYPARADFRRFAGERLERLGKAQRALIIDTYRRAVEQRPDHLTGHRMLAYALVRDGQYAEAFAAILAGIDRQYPGGRFAGAERVLSEDAGMIGAAYAAHVGSARGEVTAQLTKRGLALATRPSTRFILYWETDANDVDFHIRDARRGHAWYSHKQLPSGGELYADITTGYGPECFAIEGTPTAGPYQLSINYYSQGPMGYGMGLLQIQKFDGQGNLSFEDRPYVIMTNQAFVDLGSFR